MVFEIFNFINAVTLKIGLWVCQGLLEMSPCDRAHMDSYWL